MNARNALPRVAALSALAVLTFLAGCASFSVQEDAPARIEAALKSYATAEKKEMRSVFIQIVGTGALQTGTFRRETRVADGTVSFSQGTFEAEWERQADGSWTLVRMTLNPPPLEGPDIPVVP